MASHGSGSGWYKDCLPQGQANGFRALAAELAEELPNPEMDELLASTSLAPSPAAKRIHMDYLRKLRGKLTRLRIGGPTPDQDEWDQLMEDLYVYAKTDNLKGARQQYPPAGLRVDSRATRAEGCDYQGPLPLHPGTLMGFGPPG